jgi:glutathione S-transferase
MLTLYAYPSLFGVADNNGYGLKVYAVMRLAGLAFVHKHLFDASAAPRGQLPYIVDDDATIGDSDAIIAHLAARRGVTLDAALDARQRNLDLMVNRLLDDLYWVMSYSRWKDDRYWPTFRAALLREHPSLSDEGLAAARAHNFQRYHYQGVGRYEPAAVYARGLADLAVLAELVPAHGYVHGATATSVDAAIYGFLANIWFYDIDTPLKRFVAAQPNLRRHCLDIHAAIALEAASRSDREATRRDAEPTAPSA